MVTVTLKILSGLGLEHAKKGTIICFIACKIVKNLNNKKKNVYIPYSVVGWGEGGRPRWKMVTLSMFFIYPYLMGCLIVSVVEYKKRGFSTNRQGSE